MEPAPRIAAIHLAKGRRLPTRSHDRVLVEAAAGIVGDRYHGSRHRQVSVQSLESLAEAETTLGRPIPSGLTRRNLTVSTGVVPREPGARIAVGAVVLEVVRVAAPCRLLEDDLGAGAMAALRRRAGSICRVLEGGWLSVGDPVDLEAGRDTADDPADSPHLETASRIP